MSRIALAASGIAILCLFGADAQASHRSWWRWRTVYCVPTTQVAQPVPAAAQASPPTAPGQGETRQNLSMEPDVVIPIAPSRPVMMDREQSSRSKFPGEAQQRRLRPGSSTRW